MIQNSNGKPAYKITFSVTDGPNAGHKISKNYYLTDAAMDVSKVLLTFFGISGGNDLYHKSLVGFRCEALVGVRQCDDGITRNDARAMRHGIPPMPSQSSAPDPFAPPPNSGGGQVQASSTHKEGA